MNPLRSTFAHAGSSTATNIRQPLLASTSRLRSLHASTSSLNTPPLASSPSFPSSTPQNPATTSPLPSHPASEPTTHFGFQTVPSSQKESLVGKVFSSVASNYDLLNDSMSLGIHRLWKENFVSSLLPRLPPSPPAALGGAMTGNASPSGWDTWQPTYKILDVAGGTGDIALKMLDRAREKYGNREVQVEVVDLNEGMLREGQRRCMKTVYYNTPQLLFTHANAQSLPPHIPSSSIDLYTIAFGIRNCTSLDAVLSEAYRVLKPGGVVGVLEFGKVGNPLFKEVYKRYSFNVIPLMGQLLAGDRESYQYLVESIERFPSQVEFAKLMQNAGFKTGELKEGKGGAWTDYTGGIATFWRGVKA